MRAVFSGITRQLVVQFFCVNHVQFCACPSLVRWSLNLHLFQGWSLGGSSRSCPGCRASCRVACSRRSHRTFRPCPSARGGYRPPPRSSPCSVSPCARFSWVRYVEKETRGGVRFQRCAFQRVTTGFRCLFLCDTDATNNLCSPTLVSFMDFYNSSLDHLDLMAEYYTWQNPTAHPG